MPSPTEQLLSRTSYEADGTTTAWDFAFSGGYLLDEHVKAYTVDLSGNRTYLVVDPADLTGPFTLTVSPAVTLGYTLTIYRDTPKDLPMVDFSDGAAFTEISLDTLAKQCVFVAAESFDELTTIAIGAGADEAAASAAAAAASAASAAASAASAATSASTATGAASSASSSASSSSASAAAAQAAADSISGGPVTSVNTKTGVVVLVPSDIGAQAAGTYASGTGSANGTNTGDETGARIATLLHAATAKVTLVDADEVNGTNSASSFSLIRTVWSDVWTYIKSKADTFYALVSLTQNSQSAAYTLVLTDANKHLLHPSADTTARIWTIPANSSVAFPVGTAVTFVNQNAGGVITIAITTDTMRLAGAGTTGSRTLAANGLATALKITSTEWIINGTGLT